MQNTPSLTVDCVIFDDESVLLIRRLNEPHKGSFALPGGFVDIGETVEQAMLREAKEETGLDITDYELVGVYSDPARDTRRHTVSIAYLAIDFAGTPIAGDDAESVEFIKEWHKAEIAFDHKAIIQDAWQRHQTHSH